MAAEMEMGMRSGGALARLVGLGHELLFKIVFCLLDIVFLHALCATTPCVGDLVLAHEFQHRVL
jgi:hypothetical protein